MDLTIFVTYRCNARCIMCNIWQHPSLPSVEITPEVLSRQLPDDVFNKITLSGGEPTLRSDLLELVRVLLSKGRRIEIISNGLKPEKLIEIATRYPSTIFRISLDGRASIHDEMRGTPGAYELAMRSIQGLLDQGVSNVGISLTLGEKNLSDLMPLYELACSLGIEMSVTVPHNSFYFHKEDNAIADQPAWAAEFRKYIHALLHSRRPSLKLRIKDWFRAYLSYGLLLHVLRETRPLPCSAAEAFCFIDPAGDVIPCHGMAKKMSMGNLKEQSFEGILHSEAAGKARKVVSACQNRCWMMCTAVPMMKKNILPVVWWIAKNRFMG
ncbi:MAG: radical SAM protein [Kiritimatiellae bacterium]|nr:radical SAM protein [Kiritimatiellia bacterium]MDD4735256.1 radical SAM protein [Kiritimatiellia bacterium]